MLLKLELKNMISAIINFEDLQKLKLEDYSIEIIYGLDNDIYIKIDGKKKKIIGTEKSTITAWLGCTDEKKS